MKRSDSDSATFVEDVERRGPGKSGLDEKAPNTLQDEDIATEDDIAFLKDFEASGQHHKALRKIDMNLLPYLAVVYLLSFYDRSNIGNARIAGLEADLNLTPQQYNWGLTVFFFPYCACEVVANIPLKLFRPRVWLTFLMLSWGTVMTLMGIIQNYQGLYATRFFLGLTESGFFPCAMYMLTTWYERKELQRRIAYLYGSASAAGAFSGICSFGLAKMDGIGGLEGWRWIFIISGIITVVVGCFGPWGFKDSIASAKFFTEDERRWASKRLIVDRAGRNKGKLERKYFKHAIGDYKLWFCGFMYFSAAMSTYALSFTLPTIMRSLGYQAAEAQLVTIPPYIFACICTVVLAYFGDKYRKRSVIIYICFTASSIGLLIALCVPQPRLPGVTYFSMFLAASGIYAVVPSIIAWIGNNTAGDWKRAITLGTLLTMANSGGLVGSNIFLSRESPRYFTGFGFALACCATSIVVCAILQILLKRENRKRDRLTEKEAKEKYSAEELADLGDHSPLFRYET